MLKKDNFAGAQPRGLRCPEFDCDAAPFEYPRVATFQNKYEFFISLEKKARGQADKKQDVGRQVDVFQILGESKIFREGAPQPQEIPSLGTVNSPADIDIHN